MLGTIYTSMAGMTTFSEALDIVGNNVSNLNTPGFKGQEMVFEDLFYANSENGGEGNGQRSTSVGNGAEIGSTNTRFAQGEIRSTSNATDLAIDGNGFFIINDDGEFFYTRAGRFEFNDDDELVDSTSGGYVMALTDEGDLERITITNRTNPAVATTTVNFEGTLDSNTEDGGTYEIPTDASEPDEATITVFDSLGEAHELKIRFTKNGFVEGSTTQTVWTVEILDGSDSDTVLATDELRYEAGSMVDDYGEIEISFDPEGGEESTITLDFTATQMLSAARSTVLADQDSIDGYTRGNLVSVDFDEQGRITLTYSNGEEEEGLQIALAQFQNLQALELHGENKFVAPEGVDPQIGAPTQFGLGSIQGSSIELSNVELSLEFTDIIIAQRGYQASSHLLTVTNEMIQQLFELNGKG